MKVLSLAMLLILVSCGGRPVDPGDEPSQPKPAPEPMDIRLKVVDEIQLSENERLTLILVPSAILPDEKFATRCLLYRNVSTGASALHCGDGLD